MLKNNPKKRPRRIKKRKGWLKLRTRLKNNMKKKDNLKKRREFRNRRN